MPRPKKIVRAECGHPGCKEIARLEADNREDARRLCQKYGNGQWRCVRHSQPNEVLSLANSHIVFEAASKRVVPGCDDLFWGNSGFVHGPGFKAFADDFPPGTRIRITAEILPPTD